MTTRLFAFVIWAAVAASAMFWALRLFVAAPDAPANTTTVAAAAPRASLERLFGRSEVQAPAAEAPPEVAARFQLLGVAAPRDPARREGVALIAVDAEPPRAYRVGAVVDGDWLLQAVHARGARLGPRDGPAQIELELPPLPPPATGTLPAPGATPVPALTGVPGVPGVRMPMQPPATLPALTPVEPSDTSGEGPVTN